MKKMLFAILACAALLLPAANRKTEISGPVRDVGEIQIIADVQVPVVRYAAKELQTFLQQSTGKNITIGDEIDPEKFALILGDTPETRKMGMDYHNLPDEGYYIRRIGNRLYIVGNDSLTRDPADRGWVTMFRRATLSGVYDFLERFADVRFFFPGKYGTIVPKKGGLFLPEKIDIMESPDMMVRDTYYGQNCQVYDPAIPLMDIHKALHFRLRLSEKRIYCGHGLNFLELVRRFGKTHPEYFALRKDGKRYNDPTMEFPGQLCLSSGVREVIYQDIKAYFSGQPASSRGLKYWSGEMASGEFFGISFQDSQYWCMCEECQKIAKWNGRSYTPESRKAISDFVFRWNAEMANRLTKDGLKGILLQSAYLPHDVVPECELPENIWIEVAHHGTLKDLPGGLKSGQQIIDWHKKTGAKVFLWTYAMGKHMSKAIPNIPAMMPKETAGLLQKYQKELRGAFYEAETDRYIFNYLNYYVMSKVMWNNSLDPDKLLDDHYSSMFGNGAPYVRQVFEEMEDCWINKIVSNTVMDELGPRTQTPGDQQLWCEIYSPERLGKWAKLFESAQKAASGEAAERVVFIRQQLLGPLEEMQRKFQSSQASLDSWKVYVPGSVYLRPFRGDVNEVSTKIDLSVEDDCLVLRGTCEEPRMQDLVAKAVKNDDPNTWADSSLEFFINPSGDRKHYYHFVINSNGAVTDYRQELHRNGDISWNSGAMGRGVKEAGCWKAELRIPLKSLGKLAEEVPVNFTRHRALTGVQPKVDDYQWSPQEGARIGGFGATEKWGTMVFGKAPEKLIPFGDFSENAPQDQWIKAYPSKGQKGGFDNRIFISGGRSLYLKNVKGGLLSAGFHVPGMKPGKKYRLSYYVRTKDIRGECGARACISFCRGKDECFPYYNKPITGTNSWHRLTFEFTSPADTGKDRVPILGLWLSRAEGEVWYDRAELVEIP